jgi:hypothetical protein
MSSLLEQAIIDAKMLKETARKNAEAQILDKYSKEIKQSLEMLLEQEEAPAEASAAAEETEAVTETPDLGGEAISEESKSVMDKIPPAYLGENNMEEIELDLDTLVEKVDSMKKELNIQSAVESSGVPTPQTPTRIATDTLAEMENPETAEEGYAEEEEEESLEESFDVDESELNEMQVAPRFSEAELLAQITGLQAGPKDAATSAKIAALQAHLEAVRKEKAAAKLSEEIQIDIKNVAPGGINANTQEIKYQMDIAAALKAQLEDLKEHLTIKDAEIESLQEELLTTKAILEESKGMVVETKEKLKKSMSINVHLKESFELFSKKINEVNIINARLLYSNKVLRNASLNERQRDQIAEAISNASSVEEAKTVYETLQKSMQNIVEKRTAPQSLTEAISKAPSPFLPRKSNPVDSTTDRWKILAGIKK